MENEVINIIERYAITITEKLIKRYDELGLRATGDYEKELKYEVGKNKMIILGASHSYFMEHGRRAGGRPPIPSIVRWIENKKGLPPSMLRNKLGTAFAIANKIAKEGITVPNKHNAGKVISMVIEEFLKDDVLKMIDEISFLFKREIRSTVLTQLNAA